LHRRLACGSEQRSHERESKIGLTEPRQAD